MSKTYEEEMTLENAQADFDQFLCEKEWGNARALIDNLNELGYETTEFTKKMNQVMWVDKIKNMDTITFRGKTPFDIVGEQMQVIKKGI